MAGTWLICVTLGALLFQVNDAALGPSCSAEGAYSTDIYPMDNFDIHGLTGNWYVHKVASDDAVSGFMFYIKEDPVEMRISARLMNSPTCMSRNLNGTPKHMAGVYELSIGHFKADLWILWTDYYHGAIFALCRNGTITPGGTCDQPALLVLARHCDCQVPQDAIDEALDMTCQNEEALVEVDLSTPCQHGGDCGDGQTYSSTIYPMTELDITKFSGNWYVHKVKANVLVSSFMFYIEADPMQLGISAKFENSPDCTSIIAQGSPTDVPGKFELTTGGKRGELWILWTDYYQAALVAICNNGTITPGGTCEKPSFMVLSRHLPGVIQQDELDKALHMACLDEEQLVEVDQSTPCLPDDHCAEGTSYSKTLWPMHFTHESLRQFGGIWYVKSSNADIIVDGVMHFIVGEGDKDALGKFVGRMQHQENECVEFSFGLSCTERPGLLKATRDDGEGEMMILATDFHKYAIVISCRGSHIEPGGTCNGTTMFIVLVRQPDYEVCEHSLALALRMTCLSLDDLIDTPQDDTCAPVDDCGEHITYKPTLHPMDGLNPANWVTDKWYVKLINRISGIYSLSDRWVQYAPPEGEGKGQIWIANGRVAGGACQEIKSEIHRSGIPGITSYTVVSPPGLEMTLSSVVLATDYENYVVSTSCRNGYIAPGGYCQEAVFIAYVKELEFYVNDSVIASALSMTCWTVEDLVVMDHSHPCPEDKDVVDPNELGE